MHLYDWLSLTIFLIILFLFGTVKLKTVKKEETYLLANRKTKFFALTATLVMTEFNTATLLSFSGVGYMAQWWALTLPLIFLIGLIFYALAVAKKWKTFNGISAAHYFTQRYGKDIGVLTAFILFLAMVGFSATYVKSMTMLFSPLFPTLNPWLISGLLTSIVLGITLRGGLISIIRTDIISFIAVLAFMPLLLFFVWRIEPIDIIISSHLSLHQMQQILPGEFVFSLIILTMFSYILAPWYGQKIVSANSPKTAYFSVLTAAFFVFLLYGFGITATSLLSMKAFNLEQAETALPYLIQMALPLGLKGLGYGIFFAIASTTLAGIWSAMVTILVGEFKNPRLKSGIKRGIYLTLLCALLSYLVANTFVDHLLNKMILANIPIVALSFALLGGFYWKQASRVGVYSSIFTGLISGTGFYLFFGEEGMYTWYWAVFGIPTIFVSGIIGSFLFPDKLINKSYLKTQQVST